MADDPLAPRLTYDELLHEVATRLRPVFPELSDAVFVEVVTRIVAARLQVRAASTAAKETPGRLPPAPRPQAGIVRRVRNRP